MILVLIESAYTTFYYTVYFENRAPGLLDVPCSDVIQVPTFVVGHYVFHVVENQPAGSHVGSVSAADRDQPPRDQFVYVIDPPVTSFRIDRESGRLTTAKTMDRERQEIYRMTVSARTGKNHYSMVNHT